jgi:hypothetical protein
VRPIAIDSPHEVIAWQQTAAEDLHGFCRSLSPCDCMGIAVCALVAAAVAPFVFSHPLLLRPSVSDKAQMPARIEAERRNRMN